MKKQLEQRINELKAEFESGQKVLTELEAKQSSIQNTLLRISGAIQVLEEELAKADQLAKNSTDRLNGSGVVAAESESETASRS